MCLNIASSDVQVLYNKDVDILYVQDVKLVTLRRNRKYVHTLVHL